MSEMINIPGRLHDVSSDGVVAGANEIYDDTKGKNQQELNQELVEQKEELHEEYEILQAALDNLNPDQTEALALSTKVNELDEESVKVTEQSFTNEQKTQARANLGFGDGDFDETPTPGSERVVKSGDVFNSVISSGAFDLSAHTGDNYADLSAALTAMNALSSAYKKGGMSIKFIQSSDNKYVQYRLMTDEWSADTEDWSFCGNDVYVENPEFIRVVIDNEGKILEAIRADGTKWLSAGVEINKKIDFEGNETTIIENPEFTEVKLDGAGHILWGIQKDGNIYFGAGVPQQIINYVEGKLAELSLDEYEDIVAFLLDYLGSDTTLKVMIDGINAQIATKVDKVEGKSLIDAEYASAKSTIDNPEFLEVTTDSEDKILEGIQKDGTKFIGGDLNLGGSAKILGKMEVSGVSYKVIESPEYIAAWVDADGKVLFGFKADGKTFVGDADFLNDIKGNQEAIAEIKTTLATIYAKYAKVDSLDIDALSLISTVESPEYITVELDATGKLLEFTTKDLKKILNKDVEIAKGLQSKSLSVDGVHFSNVNDVEDRVEIKTDKEGSIISYRKSDGTLVENTKVITPAIESKVLKVTDIQQTGIPELTKKEYVYLPKPKYGELRLYGNLPTDISDSRTPTELTFIFKIDNEIKLTAKCTLSIQGHGSTNYNKKGYTFEPLNYNGDALEIKFGNMIATDSFHLKAFATDQTHARDIGGYKIWERMINALDYPYNKINNRPFEFSTSYKKNIDATADAQYHPDGFPNVVYLNDEFLGLYTLRLKKTRQNYAMEKSVKSMIFLDATNYNVYEQGQIVKRCSNLSIPFDYRGWDLKNPKLKKYEEGGEIPDSGVLANINRLFDFTSDLENQYENYADFIILPHWLVYIITEELLFSEDCLYNNINLLTWDATHWSILPYDLDLTYGLHAWTRTLYGANDMNRIMLSGDIFPTFKSLFIGELKALYTKFRKEGIISVSSIMEIYKSQINNIPRDLYEKDLSKWGSIWENGYTSIEHINTNVAARIAYLDSLWLINE